MVENMQDKALAVVRQVIGAERKVHQCSVFDDSQGKSVTVRYEGVTDTKIAQTEVARVLMALKRDGFQQYRVALFVTNDDGKNIGSVEVKPPYSDVIAFETVGNKWRGTMLKDSDFKPDKPKPLLVIDENVLLPPDFYQRAAQIFRKFYGEKRIDDGIALTPESKGDSNFAELPHEPGTDVDSSGDKMWETIRKNLPASDEPLVDADFYKRASQMLADAKQRDFYEGKFMPEDKDDAE